MNRAIRLLVLASAITIGMPAVSLAQQTASIRAEMLEDWTDLKDTLMKIANEMPADAYGFKPTPAQETFGRRVVHIGAGANRFLQLLGSKAPAPTFDPATAAMSKQTAMKAMADVFDYGIAVLNEQTDQTMLQTVKVPFSANRHRARVHVHDRPHLGPVRAARRVSAVAGSRAARQPAPVRALRHSGAALCRAELRVCGPDAPARPS